MYKGILLDIDNTLYSYEPVHQYAQQCLFNTIAEEFSISEFDIEKAFNTAKQQVKQDTPGTASSHNRLLYVQKLCEILRIDSLQFSLKLYETYWRNFLQKMTLSSSANRLFDNLNGAKVCLLTDLTAHIQHRKVVWLQLYQWADTMVTSEEAGCEKPHPYMFHLGLSKLSLQAPDVCMIGDSYKKDILGASRLGIHGYWLNAEKLERPDDFNPAIMTEIRDLEELPWI